MVIKNLEIYPFIYQKALEYQFKKDGKINLYKTIDQSFWWEDTEEGFSFWNYIENNYIDRAKELKPYMFRLPPLTILNNGLCI